MKENFIKNFKICLEFRNFCFYFKLDFRMSYLKIFNFKFYYLLAIKYLCLDSKGFNYLPFDSLSLCFICSNVIHMPFEIECNI